MGFVITILYLVTNYLTPTTIFGPLAAFRIELIFASLALLVSLPILSTRSLVWKTPQSLALISLAFATLMSVVVGAHWIGGGLPAFLGFLPSAFGYFLVGLHCTSKKKLQILILMMLFVCLFVIVQGSIELHGLPASGSFQATDTEGSQPVDMDEYPYLFAMRSDAGEWFFRLKGLGQISDPNDFGQLIVCVLPLTFIFWIPGRGLRNLFFVLLPAGALLYGVYLTHSRGALLALLAVAIVAARRRIGTIPALLMAALMFVAASALQFSGGREISADAGSDRTSLWGIGLQLLKTHPLFGVGFGQMADYAGQTAHNSLVVCAAELGLFGLYFWCVFLLSTVRDVLTMASTVKVSEGTPIPPEETPFFQPPRTIEVLDKAEINGLGRLVLLSLTGFLVAGWFLSRAFVMTLYVLGGIAEVIYEMALRRGMTPSRMPLARVLRNAFGLEVLLILLMYIMLRTVNLMH